MSTVKNSKPFVLGLDLDGVVGDYTAAFRPVVAEIKGQSIEDMSDPVEFDLSKCPGWNIVDRADFAHCHKIAINDFHIYRNMPIYDGAVARLREMSDLGVRIKIVTTRLITKGDHHKVISDTSAWLEEHGVPFSEICFVSDKAAVGADLYLDDAPHNITQIQEVLGKNRILIYDQLYNRMVDGLRVSPVEVAGKVLSQWDQLVGKILAISAI